MNTQTRVALVVGAVIALVIGIAAIVLVVMILGIVPFGVDLLCYRVFFALEDGRSPLVMQAVLTTISFTAGLITLGLEPKWAIAVVAIGQTVGNVASSTTGIILLRRRLGLLGLGQIADSTARIGVAAAPPRPIRARRTVPSLTSSANPTATPEMSSNRRFATLWKATSGLPGSGTRTARMSSSGARTVSR